MQKNFTLLIIACFLIVLTAGCTSSAGSSAVTTPTATAVPVTSAPATTQAPANPVSTTAVTAWTSTEQAAPLATDSTSAATTVQKTVSTQSSGELTASFIDVGQGDSEFIQFPSGKTMLIDAGPTSAGSTVASYLKGRGISSIDVVVATHPHEDHIGGMITVLNTFPIKQFIDSGTPATTSTYENMLNVIDQKNIPFKTAKTGDTIDLDPATSIQVLSPSVLSTSDFNQNSIVLKITYGKVTYLFTGDGAKPVEEEYASRAGNIDILKVPHHGSCTSSYAQFLSTIRPEVSVISVGAQNSYGHPCADTIARLEKIGSKVYRTDQDGTVVIASDGSTYTVENAKQATIITASTTSTVLTTKITSIPTTKITSIPTTKITTAVPTETVATSCTVNYDTGTCPTGKCWVHDYCRKDGTHVNGYCRTC